MFWVGVIVGIAAVIVVWWLLDSEETSEMTIYRARREIHDVERETVRRLLAADLAMHDIPRRSAHQSAESRETAEP